MALTLLLVCFLASETAGKVYNISGGDVKRLSLPANQTHQISVTVDNRNNLWEGFVIQAHAQFKSLNLSSTPEFTYGTYAEGTNIGLWQGLKNASVVDYTFHLKMPVHDDKVVTVMVAVVMMENEVPIPGGCTLTSALDTDPNLQLNYTFYTTTVTFHSGNVGYDIAETTSPLPCTTLPATNSNVFKVEYTIYKKLLYLGDYKESTFFDAIESFLTPKSIKDDNVVSLAMGTNEAKTTTVDSFSGDGVVYNILLTSSISGKSSVYVPAVTYACNITSGNDNCDVPLINKIFSPIVGLVGLFLCFLAHRLFHVEVFVFSWAICTLGLYMCFSLIGSATHVVILSLSFSVSLVIALVLFMVWFFSARYLPFVLFFNLMPGFLITATALYTKIGTLDLFQTNYLYGLLFLCVMVLFLIPAVIVPRALNIFTSSFVGGYLVIFSVGTFVFTSLTEILMQVVKNATISGYLKTDSYYPFSLNDIILVLVWGFLLIAGIIIQAILARKRDPFPKESLYKVVKRKLKHKRQRATVDERRLLISKVSSPTSSLLN